MITWEDMPKIISPERVGEILKLVYSGDITKETAKAILACAFVAYAERQLNGID